MNAFQIGFVILCTIFSGAMLGMLVGSLLPPHHASNEARGVIGVSMAVVGTMSALVISFLISNASNSFATRNSEITQLSSDIIQLDRVLRRYGPEADAARDALQHYTTMKFDDLFPQEMNKKPSMDNPASLKTLEQVQDLVSALKPHDDHQRLLSTEALQLADQVNNARWVLAQQKMTSVIPGPFLVGVVTWLTILFASFGLFAPRNVTVAITLLLCAFAIASAFKMVLDLESPFGGIIPISGFPIRISSEAMRHAMEAINR
ncbi:MAG TPA: hypothetical protein VMI52_13920 [Acetobacteraceae bacterium]|nr:hypothetical protein [Acetobacteraceae bacterium]